jgi:hypothetical protein
MEVLSANITWHSEAIPHPRPQTLADPLCKIYWHMQLFLFNTAT